MKLYYSKRVARATMRQGPFTRPRSTHIRVAFVLSPCVRGIRPCVPYTWRSLTTHLGVWKGAEQDECDQTVNKIVKYRCNVHCTGSFKAGWIWIGSGGNDWLLHLPFPQIIDFTDRRRDLLHCRQVIKVTNETSAWFPFSIGKLV